MTGTKVVLAFALVLAVQSHAAADGTIYGCASNTTGRLRRVGVIAPKCGPSETLTQWNESGPPGPPGPQGQPGASGPTGPQGPGLVVKDVNGTLVGLVMNTDCAGTCAATVARRFAEGVVATFQINAGGANVSTGTVLYASTDCTGTPLLPSDAYNLSRLVASVAFVSDTASATAYYQTYPGSSRQILSKLVFGYANNVGGGLGSCASLGGTFTPPDRCCLAANEIDTVAPAGTLDWTPILALVLPFHVEGP